MKSPPIIQYSLRMSTIQEYTGRRLTYEEVDNLKALVKSAEDKDCVHTILEKAGYILEISVGEYYYEPSQDTYLGSPAKLESGRIDPAEFLRWYKDAVSRGVLPEEMDEQTANLLYTTYMPESYKKNEEFYEFWENVEKLVYGDRYMSEEEAILLNEEMQEHYDPSGEI
jgi:hypothetical protein